MLGALLEGLVQLLAYLFTEVVVQLFFEGVCYFVGLGTLRLVSFGTYPPAQPSSRQEVLCSIAGLLTVITFVAGVMLWLAQR